VIPEIRPISDLARGARQLVARARQRREPVVITQRGRDVAVLLPIELYRDMQQQLAARMISPRLARADDEVVFRMQIEHVENGRAADARV